MFLYKKKNLLVYKLRMHVYLTLRVLQVGGLCAYVCVRARVLALTLSGSLFNTLSVGLMANASPPCNLEPNFTRGCFLRSERARDRERERKREREGETEGGRFQKAEE